MHDLTNAVWIELRKATRSRMPLFTALGFLVAASVQLRRLVLVGHSVLQVRRLVPAGEWDRPAAASFGSFTAKTAVNWSAPAVPKPTSSNLRNARIAASPSTQPPECARRAGKMQGMDGGNREMAVGIIVRAVQRRRFHP